MEKNKNEEAPNALEAKLNVIIYLLLKLIGNEEKPDFKVNKEIVKILSNLGTSNKEMALLFSTSESSIRNMKVRK